MTVDQIIALITAAKANGLSWLKTEGLEFKLGQEQSAPIPLSASLPTVQATLSAPLSLAFNDKADAKITPEEEQEIKHTVEHLKSVMAMDDDELINRLFPEPKEETEAAS